MGTGLSKDTANHFVVVALQNYQSTTKKCLTLVKNDVMTVLNSKSTPKWWYAVNHRTKKRGWIPSNIVAKLHAISTEPWYFGKINRVKSANLLKHPDNEPGAFLIRELESSHGQYGLSLLGTRSVVHYRISQTDRNEYFLNEKAVFRTMQELVQHHSIIKDGLEVLLGQPCCKDKPPQIDGLIMDEWEIPREDLTLETTPLGEGQFGLVYMGYWKVLKPVAIKTLKNDGTISEAHMKNFLKEAQIMKGLVHKHLVQLYGMCTKGQPIYIVTELMANGALHVYLKSDLGKMLQLNELIDIGVQIANGMAFLESKNCIHRDLATRNILLDERNCAKIADFGMARVIPEEIYMANVEGGVFPIRWTAPEALFYSRFSSKSDVWSFGILLTELVTYGDLPYPGLDNATVRRMLVKRTRMDQPKNCSESLYRIMLSCWKQVPEERPTFASLEHMLEELNRNPCDYENVYSQH